MRTLPNFMIVGAMKSGTTSLARYLAAHPDVFMSSVKEIGFFDQHFERGTGWYASHFEGCDGRRCVGEATPHYMYVPEAAQRMAGAFPEARLIAVLRNPVDRAYSHYWHQRARGREDLDFETALDVETERLAEGRDSASNYSYIDRGRYFRQLMNLTGYFSRESLCVIILEEMRADPLKCFREVCGFLGVDSGTTPTIIGEELNCYQSFRSLRLRRLAHRLPGKLGSAVGRLNIQKRPYPSMTAGTRVRLARAYEDDNHRLGKWLGRDLSQWWK